MLSRTNRWMVGLGVPIVAATQVQAEDVVGFAHESYVEDHGRMTINTEAVRVEKSLWPGAELIARGVYDSISGATPTGAPAINQLSLRDPVTHSRVPNSSITGFVRLIDGVSGATPVSSSSVSRDAIPLAESRDIRRGGDIGLGLTFGPSTFTPGISYSQETDYVSWAGSLNYSLELNEKNTVVSAGWSHAYDTILSNNFTYITGRQIKNNDEFSFGLSQVLSPQTLASFRATIGHAEGYLNDPYRSVVFQEAALDTFGRVPLAGENRPSTRDSQAFLLTLTQAVPQLDASVEGSYRYYHDSYGIIANTVGVQWFQRLGDLAVVSPSFRYYRQGAAHFYGTQFSGDPNFDPANVPAHYSSDYRLSFMETFTVGLEGTVHCGDRCDLHLGYQRYWMHGLDHQTLQSAYPRANVFTIGLNYTF